MLQAGATGIAIGQRNPGEDHVTYVQGTRNGHKVLVEKSERKIPIRYTGR
jgi:hypothetical protein